MRLEAVEALVPEALVTRRPAENLADRPCVEQEEVLAASADAPDEPGALEGPDVLRHGGERHVEWLRDVSDARLTAGEAVEDCPAGRIGDGGEDVIERGLDIQP